LEPILCLQAGTAAAAGFLPAHETPAAALRAALLVLEVI